MSLPAKVKFFVFDVNVIAPFAKNDVSSSIFSFNFFMTVSPMLTDFRNRQSVLDRMI